MSARIHRRYGPLKTKKVIIDNDDDIQYGDWVQIRNGNLEKATAGVACAGVVVDIVDKNDNSIRGSLAITGSASTSGAGNSMTVTVASDNETVDLIAALVETSPETVYTQQILGTMNTTNASNKPGGFINLSTEALVDETTHSRTITDVRTHATHGVDPDDTSRLLISLKTSEIWANTSTAA